MEVVDMELDSGDEAANESSSHPPPPGVDYDDQRRHPKYETRPLPKEYDRERSRHERPRISRFDREDYGRSYSEKRSSYNEDKDYRALSEENSASSQTRSRDSDSSRSRSKDLDRPGHYERRSYRDRSRERVRSRDRSRDRERDRDRSWDRDRKDRTRDRERDRSRGENEMECRDDIPNNSIIIKGLPPHVTEDDIRSEILRHSLRPLDVVLKRKKVTGESRGFAFVEFRLLSDAVRWKELTYGVLYFGEAKATLHYCVPREASDRLPIRLDWNCIKCGLNNFRKRDFCFKCNSPREVADINSLGGEGSDEIGSCPSSTLLFRNLDTLTTEERVLNMLGQLTVLPIKNLKVAKDSLTNISRGFAYVELHSVSEAMQLHDLLVSMTGTFYVDGRQVTVSYSRRTLSSLNSVKSANAASVAMAAAQWTNQNVNQNTFSDSTIRNKQMESVQSLNASSSNDYKKKHAPDVSSYQYDPTSGYYYDATTGYYYDANSQYYYDSKTQQYLYWDLEKQSYIVVPASENGAISATAVVSAPASKVEQSTNAVISSGAVISSAPVISSGAVISSAPVLSKKDVDKPKEKINTQDKVKFAKKVAKDMEKWAKTLNQKKENNKMMHNFTPKPAPAEQMLSKSQDDIPIPLSETYSQIEETLKIMETLKGVEMEANGRLLFAPDNKYKPESGIVAEYGGESDPEQETEFQDEGTRAMEILKSEESKLIDWDKLMCLLCKRQFPTKDVLSKHVQKSDLHKQNVSMLKLTRLTPRQLQELEKKESGYRDRAKERREKFGQPDLPPPSRLKTKYMKERREAEYMAPERPVEAIGSDNIGNKMLKAMGWSEGQGLGKSGQGMSGIIEVQRRVKSAGLGMKGSQYGATASDSYKDAVRKSMQQRYNEIS